MHFGRAIIRQIILNSTVPILQAEDGITEQPFFQVVEGFSYNSEACENDCELNATATRCGCLPTYNSTSFPMCEPEQTDVCLKNWSSEVNNTSPRNISFVVSKECRDSCGTACESFNLRSELSLSGFPAPTQLKTFQKLIQKQTGETLTEQYIKENLLAVDIFYQSMMVQTTEWYAKMTYSELLSNIGGQLGLCAGISIMTFLQTLWYLSYAVRGWLANRKKLAKVHPVTFHSEDNGKISFSQTP